MEPKNVGIQGAKMVETIVNAQNDNKKVEITKDMLVQRFGDMQSQMTKFDNISMNIEITDESSLKISETHVSTLNTHLSNIEKVRKIFKEPYLEACKRIDYHANKLKDQFLSSKKRLETAVTSYKQIEQARLKAEEEKKRDEAEKVMSEKNVEVERISRMQRQIFARLYGGTYTLKTGQKQTTAGCITADDCKTLTKFIKEKYPGRDTFKYMGDQSEDLYTISMKLIGEHTTDIIESENSDPDIRKKAIERMQLARIKIQMLIDEKEDSLQNTVQKEHSKSVKSIEKETQSAGKGLRTSILFTIINEDEVPVDMKEVSEKKINAYIRLNKVRILEMIKKGEQPVKGLNIYVQKNFVSR